MKAICFSLALIVTVFAGYAQSDSLSVQERIANKAPSKSTLIVDTRNFLIDDFLDGNKQSVAEIMQYQSQEIDDEHHQSLRLYERLLLEYWLGNYSNIILTMEIMSRAKSEEEPAFTRFYIPQDMLGYVLQSEIKKRYYEAIIQDYESLHFTPDINEFLYLLLNNLLRNQSQDELNLSADKFIKNYPSSLLVEPVKQYISYKIRPGKSGFEMGVAFGYAFYSGLITDYIQPQGGMNVDLAGYINRYFFGFNVFGDFGQVKKDIPLNNGYTWLQNESITINKIALLCGYRLPEYRYFTLTPFAGLSFNNAGYSDEEIDDDPSLKNVKLGTSVTPVCGLDLDYRLRFNNSSLANEGMFCSFGLKIAYYPNVINTQNPILKGASLFVGLSLKMHTCPFERVD